MHPARLALALALVPLAPLAAQLGTGEGQLASAPFPGQVPPGAATGPTVLAPDGGGRSDWGALFPASKTPVFQAASASAGLWAAVRTMASYTGMEAAAAAGSWDEAHALMGLGRLRAEVEQRRKAGETLSTTVHGALTGWSSAAERHQELVLEARVRGGNTRASYAEATAMRAWMAEYDADVTALRARGGRLAGSREAALEMLLTNQQRALTAHPASVMAALAPRWRRELESDLKAFSSGLPGPIP